MAKVTLNSIATVKKIDPVEITLNDQKIEIIQYLPINDKLAMVERVLNQTFEGVTGFFNPVRLEVFTILEIIKTYTNISITPKMMEKPHEVYDALSINGIIDYVIEAIPQEEYDAIFGAIEECAAHTEKYLTSFVGMMKTVTDNYKASEMNVEELMKTLGDPEQIGLVKDILEKIG